MNQGSNWIHDGRNGEGLPPGESLLFQEGDPLFQGEDLLPLDREISRALGMDEIPLDESGNPKELHGLWKLADGTVIVSLKGLVNVAADKDISCVEHRTVTEQEVVAILAWYTGAIAEAEAARVKRRRIQKVLERHELDEKSVERCRNALLKAHGLD